MQPILQKENLPDVQTVTLFIETKYKKNHSSPISYFAPLSPYLKYGIPHFIPEYHDIQGFFINFAAVLIQAIYEKSSICATYLFRRIRFVYTR